MSRLAICALCALALSVASAAAARAPAAAARAPAAAARAPAAPGLTARAAILVEASTGQRLYGRAADAELPIASATKLMTALLTLEHARLGQVFTEPDYEPAAADSQIGLRPGERMSVHDLLLALMLPSADDAAQDLAYNVGHQSVSRFVAMMNARARRLGLTHTHYSTPIGLDTPGNYSSASDLVRLAAYLRANHPYFDRVVALPSAVLRTGDRRRVVFNRNTLVGRVPWINGVKTGHTLAAGYVLVGSGTRDGITLLSAVLGTPGEAARDGDTLALLRWGFATFTLVEPVRAGQVLARLAVKDSPGTRAAVIAGGTVRGVVARGDRWRIRLVLPRRLAGPMRSQTVVGEAVVTDGAGTLGRVPVRLARALPAVAALTVLERRLSGPAVIGPLALLVVAAGLVLWRRRVLRVRQARREAVRAERRQQYEHAEVRQP
jgi:D-alanyl-D-alanine carboxypeptidase (penicillin-binding protein 5/6)